jgi:hypothetical protein
VLDHDNPINDPLIIDTWYTMALRSAFCSLGLMVRSVFWNGKQHYGTDTSRLAIASYECGAKPGRWDQCQNSRQIA